MTDSEFLNQVVSDAEQGKLLDVEQIVCLKKLAAELSTPHPDNDICNNNNCWCHETGSQY